MKLEVKDKNYCASVVRINTLIELEGAKTIQHAIIFGNSVIVGKNTKVNDIGLFFPIETKLSKDFLSNNNLYKDKTLNKDTTKSGFFEISGRVKCCKMINGKFKSSGFFITLDSLNYLGDFTFNIGDDFNIIDGKIVCEKYIIQGKENTGQSDSGKKKNKKSVKVNRVVENQYRLMNDTGMLAKEIDNINPDDIISISSKYHGTSWAVGNVLFKKIIPKWKQKITSWLGIGDELNYGIIYSSRKVVKNSFINANPSHFYGMDLWGEIAESIKHLIPKGITLYGECVGFLPSGRAIQEAKGVAFDYGCAPKTYKLLVYRITSTNYDGKVIEFSWSQITDFCKTYGFEMPNTFYYGKAKDYFPQILVSQHWHENFLGLLTSTFMLDADCPYCNNKVPEEGIVLSVDNLFERRSYKLKNFRFRMKAETEEADKGNTNIEDEQSVIDI